MGSARFPLTRSCPKHQTGTSAAASPLPHTRLHQASPLYKGLELVLPRPQVSILKRGDSNTDTCPFRCMRLFILIPKQKQSLPACTDLPLTAVLQDRPYSQHSLFFWTSFVI